MSSSQATTHGIQVSVEAEYSPRHSQPPAQYLWVYTITVSNHGEETVQLLYRHWVITDATGKREEVHGPGVVGEQPVLEPGQSFRYSSACPLNTPFGSMEGTYDLMTASGTPFQADVAPFALTRPELVN